MNYLQAIIPAIRFVSECREAMKTLVDEGNHRNTSWTKIAFIVNNLFICSNLLQKHGASLLFNLSAEMDLSPRALEFINRIDLGLRCTAIPLGIYVAKQERNSRVLLLTAINVAMVARILIQLSSPIVFPQVLLITELALRALVYFRN